jgi:2-dehydro-3-deoxygluconokinase
MRMIAMGECMMELRGSFGPAQLAYAGDTFNTALYLSRLGGDVAYATALGDDLWSSQMLAGWQAEGLDTSLTLQVAGKLPGLYAISTDAAGERSFSYWRKDSAARQFFAQTDADRVLDAIASCDLFYCSGITLSLFDAEARSRLLAAVRKLRANGATVAFDPNYRPAGWSNPSEAAAAIMEFGSVVTTALPTFDDEQMLFGDSEPGVTIERWRSVGVSEIVLKCGTMDTHYHSLGCRGSLSVDAIEAIDTTAAGDSFNAGYLFARMQGRDLQQAIGLGARLAAQVVQHTGAIIDLQAFEKLVKELPL